jgi:hypothetical protein
MVQLYDRVGVLGQEEKESKTWWKLDSGRQHGVRALLRIFVDKKYSCKSKRKGLPRLRELYVHCQRGLLSYEGLPLRELKLYATQRGLPTTSGQRLPITELKAQLERADDDATFRLMDLPPELRNIIFLHYFRSFLAPYSRYSHLTAIKSQPPITRVSRALRQESLPLFYSCWEFEADVPEAHVRHNPSYIPYRTQRLLQLTTAEQFGWIRNIKVNLNIRNINVGLAIDICSKRTPIKISYWPVENLARWLALEPEPLPLPQECVDHLTLELGAFIRSIVAREGAYKLRKSDLDQLYEQAESIIALYSDRT